jgi:hypothetical protein
LAQAKVVNALNNLKQAHFRFLNSKVDEAVQLRQPLGRDDFWTKTMLSQALEQKFRAASRQDRRLIESLLETSASLKNR